MLTVESTNKQLTRKQKIMNQLFSGLAFELLPTSNETILSIDKEIARI